MLGPIFWSYSFPKKMRPCYDCLNFYILCCIKSQAQEDLTVLSNNSQSTIFDRLCCFPVLALYQQNTYCSLFLVYLFLQSWVREHFVCVDQDRLLYHFLVEGTVIKDGSKVQCDVSDYDYLLLGGAGAENSERGSRKNFWRECNITLYPEHTCMNLLGVIPLKR